MAAASAPRDLGPSTPEEVGLSSEELAKVDAFVQRMIDERRITGAVTLTARHGRVVRTSVMGLDNRRTRKPMRDDTIFRIFSMTKPVTGLAMGILWDRGLWKPDDPIAKFLPEFANLRVFAGLDAAGAPVLEEPDHPPTMAELATHTAGFSYGGQTDSWVDQQYKKAKLLKSSSLDDFVRKLAGIPLNFQPGTQWRYGVSMDIQGAIIERLSGQSLPEFFREQIFEPLGMVDTAFFVPPSKLGRRAALYFTGKRFKLVRMPFNPLYRDGTSDPVMPMGGAGLQSTVRDYARFAQVLLDRGEFNGNRIASAEAVAMQMTNQISTELVTPGFTTGHMRFRPGFGYGFNGVVFYDPVLADLPVGLGTYMWDGAADTWFWVDPENDLLYVGMTQLLSYRAPALQEPTQRLMADAILDRKGRA